MSLRDVTVTLKRQEKNGNIFFLKQNTFLYKKIYVWHFYPKIPTGLHSGLHYLDLQPHLLETKNIQAENSSFWCFLCVCVCVCVGGGMV